MLVLENGTIEGTIGGGALEMQVMKDAAEVIRSGKPVKNIYDLDKDLDMSCGGFTEVYIEPVVPELKLYIFGAGHIGTALAKLAPEFGFNVTLFDNRQLDIVDKIKANTDFIGNDYFNSIDKAVFDERTFIVIVTPKHSYDEEILSVCAKKPSAYIGMIGSKTKIAKVKNRLLDNNILTEKDLSRIDMPIGIKFNAVSPQEIALSILAKMIDVKNRQLF